MQSESNTGKDLTPVVFIRDEPAEVDFFSTHTVLAEAIVDTVRTNSELKVIGLLGRWGSGKSTVAKMVVDRLEGDCASSFRVFTYDAWLHQSDPIRRSFLESLLNGLVDSAAIPTGKWSDKLKELNGQIEDTHVVEAPSLSPDARWLGLSLLPVPIGVGMLGLDTIKEAFGDQSTTLGLIAFLLAVVFILMPGFVWALRYLYGREWSATWRISKKGYFARRFWAIVDKDGSPSAAMQIFTNRSVTQTNTRTVRSGDPSSIEFGQVFQEIMREVATGNRRFVILIDNLDRIAEREALQMWATIRSFFLASHQTEDFKHESFHPTVILPIDRHAIEQMFRLTEDADGTDRARSFIDKTFDVTFEVTPPVGSDWRAFLLRQLKTVFGPDYQEQWGFWVRRIFEQGIPDNQVVITPREINKFVNRIAALYIQWRGKGVSVGVMALYIVKRGVVDNNLIEFIQSDNGDYSKISSNWQNEIAALHFGVPIEKAAQVALERPTRQAIVEFDRAQFAKLADIPGFPEIFEFSIADLPAGHAGRYTAFEMVSNAAILLDSLENDYGGEWKSLARQNIVDKYLSTHHDFGLSDDLNDRLRIISSFVDRNFSEMFRDVTQVGLEALLVANHTSVRQVTAVLRAASDLVTFAEQHEIELPEFELDVEANVFINEFSRLAAYPRLWPQIRTPLEGAAITEAIIGAMRVPTRDEYASITTRHLADPDADDVYAGENRADWNAVAEAATEVARSPTNYGVTATEAIKSLVALEKFEELARARLIEIVDDYTVAARLNDAVDRKGWSDVALMVAVLMWRNRPFAPPTSTTWQAMLQTKPDLSRMLIVAIRKHFPGMEMQILWNSHERSSYPTREFVETVIGDFVATGDLGDFDSRHVFENLPRYRYAVPWRQRDRFLELLNSRSDLLSAIETEPLGPQITEAAKFLKAKGGDTAERVAAIVRQRVEEATVPAWASAIADGAAPYGLLEQAKAGQPLQFNRRSALFEALISAVPTMIGRAGHEMRERWFELSQLLNPNARTSVFSELSARMSESSSAQSLHLLKAGGQKFLKQKGFAKEPDRAVGTVILAQLQSKAGRDWLKDNDEIMRGWLQRAGEPVRNEVRDLLTKLSKSKLEDRSYMAKLLLERWKLERALTTD